MSYYSAKDHDEQNTEAITAFRYNRIKAIVTNAEPGPDLRSALQSANVHLNLCGV